MSGQKKNTKAKIRLSFLAAFVCIGFFVLITYRNMLLTESESRHINYAVEKLLKLDAIQADLQDIESGQRGFIITGEEKFLDDYYTGLNNLKQDTIVLKSLAEKDSLHKSNYATLLALVNQKISHTKYSVELRRLFGYNAASTAVQNEEGLRLMKDIKSELSFLASKDQGLLNSSIRNRDRLSQKRAWQLFSLAAIFYIILLINYKVIIRDYNIQQENERVLKYNASLISIISDAVITTDKDFKITNWNKYAAQLYGYDEKEVLGMTINEVMKVDYSHFDRDEVMKEFEETDHWRGEVIHHNKAGEPLNVDVAVSVIRDTNGNNVGTVSVIRDVTDRRRTQERLQQLTTHLEEEVKHKVRELNSVFERITDAFIALDNNWRYTYVNKRAAELHGKQPEELIGKVIWEVFPEVVNEPFYHALMQAREDKVSRRRELYFSKTNSWYEDLIYPSEDGISIYYHDISKRKQAEQQLLDSQRDLKESNERFILVSQATNDAVWDWDMISDTIWGNESFRRIFNIHEGEKISFSEYIRRLHDTDKDTVLLNLKKALDEGRTLLTEEFQFRTDEGSFRYFFDRAYILYNEEGKAYRMLGAMQDITSQKQAQQQIIQEKELSDSIINSLPGIFYVLNKEGFYYRWNKNLEQVTGYTEDEFAQMNCLALFSDDQKSLIAEKMRSVFINGEDRVEADILTRDGRRIPYYFTGMVINYEGENCLMGVGFDITERVQSQLELKKSHQDLRDLATHLQDIREDERTRIAREIHDELGQQLTGLKMDISWLSKKVHSPNEEINVKLSEALALIDDTVKTVRRIATQLRPSILDDLGLVSAIEWQADEFEKRFKIKTAFHSTLGNIAIDKEIATGIFRIFQECLTNVLRHSQATEVKSMLSASNGVLRLLVSDNGIGFNANAIETKKTLGLLGMKERTLIMGGTYDINSKPGEGTTVHIAVPLATSENEEV